MVTLEIDTTMLIDIIFVICLIVGFMMLLLSFEDRQHRTRWALMGACAMLSCDAIICCLIPPSQELYDEYLEDNYTVFLDGEEVTYPDKINVNEYNMTVDTNSKEVILRRHCLRSH